MCSYKMVLVAGRDVFTIPPLKPFPSLYKDQSTITVSLPPNKHFNLTITAYNGYGNTSTTVVISTFDVVVVSINTSSPMGLVCLFNTGSLARGCLVYLTDTDTGVTYCRVVWRSLDKPVSTSLCLSSNGPLSTRVYSVEVYDIERDGSVSSVPALAGEIVTVFGPSTEYGPSTVYVISSSRTLTADQGDVINTVYIAGISAGSAVVSSAVILFLVITVYVCQKKKRRKKDFNIDPLTASCAAYGITVKCSDEIKMADNPVYGVTY
eukprot:Em0012g114a